VSKWLDYEKSSSKLVKPDELSVQTLNFPDPTSSNHTKTQINYEWFYIENFKVFDHFKADKDIPAESSKCIQDLQ